VSTPKRKDGGPGRDHLTGHDTAVILGGATAGNELRTELVRDFLDGGLRIGEISGLVSHRYFSACERDKILIQDGVDTEWEHLRWYLAATFGPLEAAESVAGGKGSQHWLDEQFQRRKQPEGVGGPFARETRFSTVSAGRRCHAKDPQWPINVVSLRVFTEMEHEVV